MIVGQFYTLIELCNEYIDSGFEHLIYEEDDFGKNLVNILFNIFEKEKQTIIKDKIAQLI